MSKYLKLFENNTQYETFIGGGGNTPFVKPNVSYCTEENEVHYNPRTWADEYLTFVALENTTFTFTPANNNVISYSMDNGDNWSVGNSVELTKDNKTTIELTNQELNLIKTAMEMWSNTSFSKSREESDIAKDILNKLK